MLDTNTAKSESGVGFVRLNRVTDPEKNETASGPLPQKQGPDLKALHEERTLHTPETK